MRSKNETDLPINLGISYFLLMFSWAFLAEVCNSKLHEIIYCCVYLLLVWYNGHVNTKFIIYLLLSYFIPIVQLHISSLKWGKYFTDYGTHYLSSQKIYINWCILENLNLSSFKSDIAKAELAMHEKDQVWYFKDTSIEELQLNCI